MEELAAAEAEQGRAAAARADAEAAVAAAAETQAAAMAEANRKVAEAIEAGAAATQSADDHGSFFSWSAGIWASSSPYRALDFGTDLDDSTSKAAPPRRSLEASFDAGGSETSSEMFSSYNSSSSQPARLPVDFGGSPRSSIASPEPELPKLDIDAVPKLDIDAAACPATSRTPTPTPTPPRLSPVLRSPRQGLLIESPRSPDDDDARSSQLSWLLAKEQEGVEGLASTRSPAPVLAADWSAPPTPQLLEDQLRVEARPPAATPRGAARHLQTVWRVHQAATEMRRNLIESARMSKRPQRFSWLHGLQSKDLRLEQRALVYSRGQQSRLRLRKNKTRRLRFVDMAEAAARPDRSPVCWVVSMLDGVNEYEFHAASVEARDAWVAAVRAKVEEQHVLCVQQGAVRATEAGMASPGGLESFEGLRWLDAPSPGSSWNSSPFASLRAHSEASGGWESDDEPGVRRSVTM